MQQNLFLLISFLFFNYLQSQSLSVTPTDATCPQNGELSWSLTNIPDGATVTYLVEDASGNVIAGPLSQTMLAGLIPGDYEVIATINDNGAVTTVTSQSTIDDIFENLAYQLVVFDEKCGGDASIEFIIDSGILEEIDLDGPIVLDNQTSNTIENLVAGNYTATLTDVCGNTTVTGITILQLDTEFTASVFTGSFDERYRNQGLTCDEIIANVRFSNVTFETIERYATPLTFTFTVYPPDGNTAQVLTFVESNLSPFVNQFIIPWYPGESYSYDLRIEDSCGEVLELLNNNVFQEKQIWSPSVYSENCINCYAVPIKHTRGEVYVNFLSAPSGFNPVDFIPSYPGPIPLGDNNNDEMIVCNDSMSFPSGDYTLEVTDDCGVKTEMYSVADESNFSVAYELEFVSCNIGEGDLFLQFSNEIQSLEFLSGPMGAMDVSSFIGNWSNRNDVAVIENIPSGTYVVKGTSICGVETTYTAVIDGLQVFDRVVEIQPQCNSFDIYYFESNNGIQNGGRKTRYYLYLNGTVVTELNNGITTTNILGAGDFEIRREIYQQTEPYCSETVHEFSYDNSGVDLINLTALPCSDGTYNLFADAIGVAPIDYSIVEIDGVSTLIDNGGDSVFTGLNAGIYTVEISNPCGSSLREIEVTNASQPAVSGIVCDGASGCIEVIGYDFLSFEWYKNSDPASILSTTPQLCFNQFDVTTQAGDYSVRVYYDADLTCFDQILNYSIDGACCSVDPDDGCTITEDSVNEETCEVINTPIGLDDGCVLTEDVFNAEFCFIENIGPSYVFENETIQACPGDTITVNLSPMNLNPVPEGTIVGVYDYQDGVYINIVADENGNAVFEYTLSEDLGNNTFLDFAIESYTYQNEFGYVCTAYDYEYLGFLSILIGECNPCLGINPDDGCPLTEDSVDPETCDIINTPIIEDDGCYLTDYIFFPDQCYGHQQGPSVVFEGYPNIDLTVCNGDQIALNIIPYPDEEGPLASNATVEVYIGNDLFIVQLDGNGEGSINFVADINDPYFQSNGVIDVFADSFTGTNPDGSTCIAYDEYAEGYLSIIVEQCDPCADIDPSDGCHLTQDSVVPETCEIINTPPDVDDGCVLTVDSFDPAGCQIINEEPAYIFDVYPDYLYGPYCEGQDFTLTMIPIDGISVPENTTVTVNIYDENNVDLGYQSLAVQIDANGNATVTLTAPEVTGIDYVGSDGSFELAIESYSYTDDNGNTCSVYDRMYDGFALIEIEKIDEPTTENCWDKFVFNSSICGYDNIGVEPEQPIAENCWDDYQFDIDVCGWVNIGEQDEQPPAVNCWDDYQFDIDVCGWVNEGEQDEQPPAVNCWDDYQFDIDVCGWVNEGEQDEQPPAVNCWDDYQFDIDVCGWLNVGEQHPEPEVECYEQTIFDQESCDWIIELRHDSTVGCTNPESYNYNVYATCDNGTCLSDSTLVAGECEKCESEIVITFKSNCKCVFIQSSCKNLSNVVIRTSEGDYKYDDLNGLNGSFCSTNDLVIETVWVKAGCYKSGDGPGYGYRFDNPIGCEDPIQEDDMEDDTNSEVITVTDGECKGCKSEVEVNFLSDCKCINVTSLCKDLSNVVIRTSEGDHKFDDLSGLNDSFCSQNNFDIETVWVKAGCFKSGDGPGYGYRFDNPQECSKTISDNSGEDLDARSLLDSDQVKDIEIYPNPTFNEINIEGLDKNEKFYILDIQGKVISSFIGRNKINVDELSPALYLIKTENGRIAKFYKL